MKAELCLVTLVTLCVCLPVVYGAEEEIENLLINPSIEEVKEDDVIWRPGDPNREDKFAWHVRGTDKEISEASLDAADKIDGEQSLYTKRRKGGWIGIEQGYWTGAKEIVLEPDTTYTLAAWMRSSEPGEVIMKLGSWEDPFPKWGEKKVRVKTSWEEYYLTATAKDGTPRTWCEFRFGDALTDLWFDFAHLYVGEYVLSEGPHSLSAKGELAITWGGIKQSVEYQ